MKIFKNLTFWVLTAITLGILLGHFRPDLALYKVLEAPIKGRFLGQELEIGATFSEMLKSRNIRHQHTEESTSISSI